MCGARYLLICLLLAGYSMSACAKPAPLSIDALRAKHFSATLKFVRKLDDTAEFSAELFSYQSAGLTIYAMVAVPRTSVPSSGFPVLIANHGFHPDPPRYGITAQGIDSRPGDYYRSIPALYAEQGFLVVIPDYRGHSSSQGREFTSGFLATGYYTEDVLALLSALPGIENADLGNIFMWGHSLGGEVSLRALLASDKIKGAALWSSVGGDIWDQAYYYSRYDNPGATDSSDTAKPAFDKLRQEIAQLGVPYDWRTREPLRYLNYLRTPLIIHHSSADQECDYKWSARLAKELYLGGHPYVFNTYSGSNHFLAPPERQEAVARDASFFRALMSGHAEPAKREPNPGSASE